MLRRTILGAVGGGTLTAALPEMGTPTEHGTPTIEPVARVQHHDALDNAHDVQIRDALAYVVGKDSSMGIVDLTYPKAARVVGGISGQLPNAQTVIPVGNVAYIGTNRGLETVDISNPSAPTVTGGVTQTQTDKINGWSLYQQYLIASNKDGWIHVFDIGDPAAPSLHAEIDTSAHAVTAPHDITIAGSQVITCAKDGSPRQFALYEIIDASAHRIPGDSAEWSLTATLCDDRFTHANRVRSRGPFAFTAGKYLTAVDISDPSDPVIVSATATGGGDAATGLDICGNYAVTVAGEAVEIWDISDPTNVSLANQYIEPALTRSVTGGHDMELYGDLLAVTAGQRDSDSLLLYQLDLPKTPGVHAAHLRAEQANVDGRLYARDVVATNAIYVGGHAVDVHDANE